MSDTPRQPPSGPTPLLRRAAGMVAGRPIARAVIVLFSGDAVAQVLLLLIAPLVTRLYTPDEFGVATVYAALLAITVVIAALRYEFAVPVPGPDDDGVNVLAAAVVASVFTGAAGVALYLAVARQIDILDSGLPGGVAGLFGLSMLLNGSLAAFGGWAIRRQRYELLARSRIARTGSQATLQVGLGWAGWGAIGLVVAALAGTTVALATLAVGFFRQDGHQLAGVSRARVREAFGRYRRFPLFSGTAALVQAVNVEVPYVVFGSIYPGADVGSMGLARRTLGAPLYTLSDAVGRVFFGHSAELVRTNPDELERFVRRMTLALAGLFVPIGVGAFVALPPLTTALFGSEWAGAADFIRVMIPMFVLQAIATPTGFVLDVLERQDLHLARDVLRLLIGLVAVGLVVATDVSPVQGMLVYVAFACVGAIVFITTSFTAVRRHRAALNTAR